ncbi:carbohydrate ABC transporter permease [Allorhizocola rhizosphaerae]|uniref:carbohydrate ABC transporter permease n=1 Tax=Allorhizocola rhizosphaerae TaxID=1872709 RepID=UPI000E3ED875|nr:carbohydrate ABC transporter permease [Allorhizocola rhizosphaerae]
MIRRLVLIVLGLIWLAPTYLLLANAARGLDDYDPERIWDLPGSFELLANMADAWARVELGPSIGATFLYAVVAPAAAVVIGAMAGFGISVLRVKGGFGWFMLIFGGTIFPTQMLLIPLFFGFSSTQLYDTRLGLLVIYTAISVPFAAFVMRNFFTGVAHSLFEAARMDGANLWRVFWRIYLPLALPALGAVFILEFTFIWNDLLFGLTLSQSPEVRPIMTAVSSLNSAYAGTRMPVILAAGILVSLPTVALFLFTQRIFARGLALGQF